MKSYFKVIRNVSKVVALIYAIPLVILFTIMIFMANRPWPLSDYVYFGLMLIYITGLFLSLKNPGLGGLLCAPLPLKHLHIVISLFNSRFQDHPDYHSTINDTMLIQNSRLFVIIIIPCILFLITWNISRKHKSNTESPVT